MPPGDGCPYPCPDHGKKGHTHRWLCSRCGRRRAYNPCRDCSTPTELARTFETTSRGKPVTLPWFPELPERYRQYGHAPPAGDP